jgi:SpoVK/Ycf46/Vps4 family AAA+-type ATPase
LKVGTEISEKIGGLIQSTSGDALPGFAIYATGLFVLLAIFLIIALAVKKGKWMKDRSAPEKIIEPQKQEQATEEAASGSEIKEPVGNETVSEQQIEKNMTKMIHETGKDTFLSGSSMSSEPKSLGNLINEIQRIDQIISLYIDKWRKEHSKDANELPGLCITEDEVNEILRAPKYELEAGSESEKTLTISQEIYESIEKEKYPRLYNLQKLFHLDPFEVEVLLICLASELDTRYEKLYAYLQNDVTKKRPTVDLGINLLCTSIEEKLRAREYFSPEANLIRNRLIYLTEDGPEGQITLLSRSIRIDDRIVNHLLGSDEIDQRIRNFSEIIEPIRSFDDLIFSDKEKNAIQELIERRSNIKNPIFFFHGAYGTGKKMTAEVICRKMAIPLFVVDSKVLLKGDSQETLKIIIREACLQNSLLYLEGFDVLLEKETGINVTKLIQELDLFSNWIFLTGEMSYTPSGIIKKHSFIDMSFPIPSFTVRQNLWKSLLAEKVLDLDIDALAGKFNFSGGQIKDAIFTARNFALVREPADHRITMDDLYQGCKIQSNKNLALFARSISPRYTWNDIVLPKDLKEHLTEVSGHIKHKGKVYTEWGFDAKLSLGKGLNVLFSGPSGAGKTLAAEILAKEVGLDIYKIDLSTVVSKYIGETEKHLNKIFFEAETSNAILFFDEADALFGKRSEVKDSHDRYANIEINYLLQKMEEHEGIVILASNFKTNIDEAFLRRMHFVMEFPFPEEELREKIWRNIFPEKTPIDKPWFFRCDFKNAGSLRTKLRNTKDAVSQYIREQLSPDMQMMISEPYETGAILDFSKGLVDEMNKLIKSVHLFDKQLFSQVKLRGETKRLLEQNPEGEMLILLNRLLLEDAYPHEIVRSSIDYVFLSKFKFTGGNIKNIALSAAFLAAEDSCVVRMGHIIRATKREFQKMGKLCTPEDFGEYYELIK